MLWPSMAPIASGLARRSVPRWPRCGAGCGSCYWASLDANENIIDNHYGLAGGIVVIRVSDYEVAFAGCGVWEYLGQ